MDKTAEAIGVFVIAIILLLFVSAVIAYPFMLVWNYYLVPAITVLKPVGLIQAFWISIFMGCFVRGWSSSSNK